MRDPASPDELAIRSVAERYADAVVRKHAGDWQQTWSEEEACTWSLFGKPIEGREAILRTFEGAIATFDWVVQHVHNGVIEVDGDRARARFTISEIGVTTEGRATRLHALYHDELRREGGGWRFTRRELETVYYGSPDLR